MGQAEKKGGGVMDDRKEGYVGTCPAGKKTYWALVETNRSILASGTENTLEEAEDLMWAMAAILGIKAEESRHIAEWAKTEEYNAAHNRPTGEVVYREYYLDDGCGMHHEMFPIVRKTAKRVFIQKQAPWNTVISLDRHVLETTGRAWSQRHREAYYSQPYEVRNAVQIAEEKRQVEAIDRKRAGLRATVTQDELKAAAEFFVGLEPAKHFDLYDQALILRALHDCRKEPKPELSDEEFLRELESL